MLIRVTHCALKYLNTDISSIRRIQVSLQISRLLLTFTKTCGMTDTFVLQTIIQIELRFAKRPRMSIHISGIEKVNFFKRF